MESHQRDTDCENVVNHLNQNSLLPHQLSPPSKTPLIQAKQVCTTGPQLPHTHTHTHLRTMLWTSLKIILTRPFSGKGRYLPLYLSGYHTHFVISLPCVLLQLWSTNLQSVLLNLVLPFTLSLFFLRQGFTMMFRLVLNWLWRPGGPWTWRDPPTSPPKC